MKRAVAVALIVALCAATASAGLITIAGGRSSPPAGGGATTAPTWATTAISNGWDVGEWIAISGASPTAGYGLSTTNTIADENPCPLNNCAYSANDNQACVITCWNGAALAANASTKGVYFQWGGGHSGYWGNEVYLFDVDTRTWSRVTDPYDGMSGGWSEADGVWPDGTPVVPHTYNNVVYHPTSKRVCSLHVEINSAGGQEARHGVCFDLDDNTWYVAASNGLTGGYGGWTIYDPTRDLFVTEDGFGSHRWTECQVSADPEDCSYTDRAPKFFTGDDLAVYNPVDDIIMVGRNNSGTMQDLYGIHMDSLAGSPTLLTVSAGEPTFNRSGHDWSTTLGALVLHTPSSATVTKAVKGVGTWNSATWTWTGITAGTNTVTPTAKTNGIYNSFRIITYDDGIEFALEAATINGPVYAFRLN